MYTMKYFEIANLTKYFQISSENFINFKYSLQVTQEIYEFQNKSVIDIRKSGFTTKIEIMVNVHVRNIVSRFPGITGISSNSCKLTLGSVNLVTCVKFCCS